MKPAKEIKPGKIVIKPAKINIILWKQYKISRKPEPLIIKIITKR